MRSISAISSGKRVNRVLSLPMGWEWLSSYIQPENTLCIWIAFDSHDQATYAAGSHRLGGTFLLQFGFIFLCFLKHIQYLFSRVSLSLSSINLVSSCFLSQTSIISRESHERIQVKRGVFYRKVKQISLEFRSHEQGGGSMFVERVKTSLKKSRCYMTGRDLVHVREGRWAWNRYYSY